jgi:hypothetical protein
MNQQQVAKHLTGDSLWEGATPGWYTGKADDWNDEDQTFEGDTEGPFDSQREAEANIALNAAIATNPRAEDEGKRAVEAAVHCTIFLYKNLTPDEAEDHDGIADAVTFALEEAGWDDREAMEATAMKRFQDELERFIG